MTKAEAVTTRQVQLNAVRKSRATVSKVRAMRRKVRSRLKRNLDGSGSRVDGAGAMVSLADELAQSEGQRHMNCSCVGTDASRVEAVIINCDSHMSWRDVLSRSNALICCMERYHRRMNAIDVAGGVLECGKSES